MYEILDGCYVTQGKVNDIALNVYTTQLPESKRQQFNDIGGLKTLKRFGRIAEQSTNETPKIITSLKTYSTLRHLQSKNINIEPYLDKFVEQDSEYILNVYQQALTQIGLYTQGEKSPNRLNKGIREYVADLRTNPDVGIPFPLPIVSTYTRGLHKGSITGLMAHTNKGKTRLLTDILTDISVKNKIRTMFISTEQTEKEMKLQYLTSIWNNIIAKTPEDEIEESHLATMELTPKEEELLEQTTAYFEENCELFFECVSKYDLPTLTRYLKMAALMGCEIVCIDVLKPCRINNTGKYNEWQEFAATVEALRNLALELQLAVLFTAHLNTSSIESGSLEISSIANGTQIAFVCDVVLMFRDITMEEKLKSSVKITTPDSPFNGEYQALDADKNHMLCKITKNRYGSAGGEIVLEVEKGKNKFRELGFFNRKQSK